MQNNPDAVREAMRMANSSEGQQLLKLLQQSGGRELNQAMEKAAAGDYTAVRALLANVLRDPQARQLLDRMGGSHGSAGR